MKKKERKNRLNKNKKIFLLTVILFVFILVITLIIFWFKFIKLPKFTVIQKTDDGGGEVLIIDPRTDIVIRYKIDPNIVLDSAYGYGEYKLSSLWTLGDKEGLGGDLVVKSIASNFLIPVYLWDSDSKSNLNLYQKIKLNLVSKKDNNEAIQFKSFDLPNSILINFVNEEIQESGIGVEVEDLTGNPETIDKVSKLIGILGTKVSGYAKGYDKEFDCEVYASDIEIRNLVSNIFDCNGFTNESENKLKIKLGAKFADRF